MKDNRFRKGEYENAVEYAKDLLNKRVGMLEIMDKTNLNEDQIHKIQRKREMELNDKTEGRHF
jgi:hypothetical protein